MNPNNNMLTVVHTSGIVRVPVVSSEEQASSHTSDKVLRELGCVLVLT